MGNRQTIKRQELAQGDWRKNCQRCHHDRLLQVAEKHTFGLKLPWPRKLVFPFMSAVGSDLVGIYVGEGARKMKDIFKEARELAKAEGGCIIFFDEVDSFATPRSSNHNYGGGTISHNATINQFLTELDGLRQQENNIVCPGSHQCQGRSIGPRYFARRTH